MQSNQHDYTEGFKYHNVCYFLHNYQDLYPLNIFQVPINE